MPEDVIRKLNPQGTNRVTRYNHQHYIHSDVGGYIIRITVIIWIHSAINIFTSRASPTTPCTCCWS